MTSISNFFYFHFMYATNCVVRLQSLNLGNVNKICMHARYVDQVKANK